ncbi:MAG: hypothetical protein ABI685_06550 [Ferruginibacter sp.]
MALQKTNTAAQRPPLIQSSLLLLSNKPNTKFYRQQIATHPHYLAITAVTHFLNACNIPCNAVQAIALYIHEFIHPLIAHKNKAGIKRLTRIPSLQIVAGPKLSNEGKNRCKYLFYYKLNNVALYFKMVHQFRFITVD